MKLQSKHQPEFQEVDMPQVLGEHVCRVVIYINIEDFNVLLFDHFTNVVVPNINMLGSSLSHRVRRDENGALVVASNRDRSKLIADLAEKLADPDYLAAAIRERHILCFC